MKLEATYPVRVYKDRFTQMIAAVERGQAHIITKHGRPVARVIPMGAGHSVSQAVQAIKAGRVQGRVNLKASIEEGRL